MSDTALDAFSRHFAARLLEAYPHWRSFVQTDPDGAPSSGSLRVVVPSPVAGRHLLVRSYGDQITVDFGPDGWHEHVVGRAYPDPDAACTAALRLIDDLLADRKLVATRYILGKRMWSRLIDARDARGPRLGYIRITSWSGRRDSTLTRPDEQD